MPAKPSFREKLLQVREDAIVDVVNRLLADKGFDQMTVDQVAAEVGIAKASLYKHFESKEALAAAAMIRVLQRASDHLLWLTAQGTMSVVDRLKAVVAWTIDVQLAGEMPSLPAQNSTLRTALMGNREYMALLMRVTDELGAWIVEAQGHGDIDDTLPAEVVLYTLLARACDPVLTLLKASGQHTPEQIRGWLMRICFLGLSSRPAGRAGLPRAPRSSGPARPAPASPPPRPSRPSRPPRSPR